MSVITLTINDEMVSAAEGQSLLAVIRENKIDVPTLCHLDGLSEKGGCRLCVVEVGNSGRLQAACVTTAVEGLEVHTHTEKVVKYRKMLLELLFSERNHVCSSCVMSGHCELQWQAASVGMDNVRFPYMDPDLSIDASHKRFVMDHNRCILCTRCVRVCDEIEGAHVLDVGGRGVLSRIVADLNKPWGESETCTSCGKCVQVCPTGALSNKGSTVAEMSKRQDFLEWILNGRNRKEWSHTQ